MVEVMGLVAIIKGDEFLVGIEIKVTEAVKIRRLTTCISSNIIITSNMSKTIHNYIGLYVRPKKLDFGHFWQFSKTTKNTNNI